MKLQNKSQLCLSGNYIINLFIVLCNLNMITSDHDPTKVAELPKDWPSMWSNGTIPFVFDYFSTSPKRLMSIVHNGLEFLESRSCLKFVEQDPRDVAKISDITYLFFSYSDVLESCCLNYYTKPTGRRMVLLTPVCQTSPSEVAHATLHGMGLSHEKRQPFSTVGAEAVLFPYLCENAAEKLNVFGLTL